MGTLLCISSLLLVSLCNAEQVLSTRASLR